MLVTMIHMLFMAVRQPYRGLDDDYFTLACNFALAVVFFFTMTLKYTKLTDAVRVVMTDTMRQRYEFSLAALTAGLFASVFSALAIMTFMAARHASDGAPAVAPPPW